MLETLYVKDFAIVAEAEIAFGAGMTVVTGETGAGKSLLVDALLLLAGGRADAGAGAPRLPSAPSLSATFDLADARRPARLARERGTRRGRRLPAAPRDPQRRQLARLDQRPAGHADAAEGARLAA